MSLQGLYLPRVWAGSQLVHEFLPTEIRPLTAHIKLTENCQARCISCDYWKSRWKDHIDTDRAIALINEIGDLDIRALRFTGGEPLIRKDFFEVLARADTRRFHRIVVQTNGLLLHRFADRVNDSPITHVNVSVDGLRETNDRIRGVKGYFDLAVEGIQALRHKQANFSVTLNGLSARELDGLARTAEEIGAGIEFNILSTSLFFLADAEVSEMWPSREETQAIVAFVRDRMKRPGYEVEYIRRYYNHEPIIEPPCVLGYLQVFVLSNGDVLTGCYPLPAVGNILRKSMSEVLASKAYIGQAERMVRRQCPGCTCGVESSLAMRNPLSSAVFEAGQLLAKPRGAAPSDAARDGARPLPQAERL